VSEATVRNWESGRCEPLVRQIPGIIRLLGRNPEPPGRSLGGRLRVARRRLGLTQAELARTLALDEGTLSDVERSRRSIQGRVRRKLLDFLGFADASA